MNIPANTGWLWVKQGYQYFTKQPMEFANLFLCYLIFMLLLSIIPYLGQILAFILLPIFTLSFMQACREIERGKRAHPRLLLYGFQAPHVSRLLQLGFLYLIAAMAALAASALIDGGAFWKIISGQLELNEKNVEGVNLTGAMLFSVVLYIPALMGFWFAGPLIAWQKMSLFKAIFYSFFATLRSTQAFLVYGLVWFVLGGILPTIISVIVTILTGSPNLIVVIMVPFSMILTVIFYCSFYPTYQSIFGEPDAIEPSTVL